MLYIFITTDVRFKFDLQRLTFPNANMVLICHTSFSQAHEAQSQSFFRDIIFTDNFTFDNLSKIIEQTSAKFNIASPVLVTADEMVMMVTAKLRDKFKSHGYNANIIERFTNKIVMKERLKDHNIELPRFIRFDGTKFKADPAGYIEEAISFLRLPIFAKPVSGTGCMDTTKINNREELLLWCESHAGFDNFELDEFISGTLYHCDSIVQDGEIKHSFVCQEIVPCFDFSAGKMLCSLILPEQNHELKRIQDFNEKVLEALSPPEDCVTHCECFKTEDGRIVFLEIACRAVGAKVPQLYEKCFGWNIQEACFRLQMGLDIDTDEVYDCYAANCMFPRACGTIARKNELPHLQSDYEIYWDVQPGQTTDRSKDINSISCTLVLWNKNYSELRADVDILNGWSPVTVKPV